MVKERNIVFDAVKLFAIFLVVWGHALAYFQTGDFTENRIFLAIYSFHMPLFMTVVGFFSGTVADMGLKEIVLKKARQLLLPAVVFYLPLAAVVLVKSGLSTMIHSYIGAFWFLKSAFICFVIYYAAKKICKSTAVAAVVSLAISMFIIDFMICRMLPFFLFGLLLGNIYPRVRPHSGIIAAVSGVVFLPLLPLFDVDVYKTLRLSPILTVLNFSSSDYTEVYGCLVALASGLSGSLFVIFLFEYLSTKIPSGNNWSKIAVLGSETLAVYMFNTVLIELPPKYVGHLDGMNPVLYNVVVTPLAAIAVIVQTHYIVGLIKRNRWLSFLILGKALNSRHSSQLSLSRPVD